MYTTETLKLLGGRGTRFQRIGYHTDIADTSARDQGTYPILPYIYAVGTTTVHDRYISTLLIVYKQESKAREE